MSRFIRFGGILGLLGVCLSAACGAAQSAPPSARTLMGTVTSVDGKPLEGIAVSARAKEKTFTTTVFTDARGEYAFPSLDDGQYRVWAQAVGFERPVAAQTIASGNWSRQDFALKPFADIHTQLSGAEWMESLPEATPEDRRMKRVFANTCGACHQAGYVLQMRFDADGWETLINQMIEIATSDDRPLGRKPVVDEEGEPLGPSRQLLEAYKQDMIAYLTRVRGPNSPPLEYKVFPRPRGEATAIVVTEYDVPFLDERDRYGNYDYRNGSDWSRGHRAGGETITHDAMYSIKDGNVYFTNSPTPGRSIGKLDPRTGQVTSIFVPNLGKGGREGRPGIAAGTQFGDVDRDGNIWLLSVSSKMLVRFDPATQMFQRFPYPEPRTLYLHGGASVDKNGWVWGSADIDGKLDSGAGSLNPQTGEYAFYKAPTPGSRPYDAVLDAEDNAWVTLIAADRLAVVDAKTRKVSEVVLPPLDEDIDPRDRAIGERIGAWTDGAPVFHRGPRRLGADLNGNTVWVGQYYAGRIAKIDIHTKQITDYRVPDGRFAKPYKIAVDKNHMVWFGQANSDRLGRFNPMTEQFTMYQMPTRSMNPRHINIDNTTDPPTIWLPYEDANKIARIQLRAPGN